MSQNAVASCKVGSGYTVMLDTKC